jgi:hypothetical protein
MQVVRLRPLIQVSQGIASSRVQPIVKGYSALSPRPGMLGREEVGVEGQLSNLPTFVSNLASFRYPMIFLMESTDPFLYVTPG